MIKVTIRKSLTDNIRYIESGEGIWYRCYGVATNATAAKRFAAEIRRALHDAKKEVKR